MIMMIMWFRPKRIAAAIAIAIATIVATAGTASAQFGEAAGFGEIMSPYYLRRDLAVFTDGLELDEDQQAIVESFYWDYEEAQEASRQAMLDKFSAMRDEMKELGREEVLEMVFRPFQDRATDWDRLNSQLVMNVQAILSAPQLARWADFERLLLRSKELPQGKFSGESVDLFRIVKMLDLTPQQREGVDPVLEQYALRLDNALKARTALIRASRLAMMESIQRSENGQALDILVKQNQARLAVRSINDEYTLAIAAALPEPYATRFAREARAEAYPRVYRPTMAQRLLAMAKSIDDLTPETLKAVEELEAGYLAEIDVLNAELTEGVRNWEPKEQVQRAEMANQQRATGQTVRFDDPTREKFKVRVDLDRRYVDQLQALLTPEQFSGMSGATRYSKSLGKDGDEKALEESGEERPSRRSR